MNTFDNEINETLRIAGIQLNESEENYNVNDILVDDSNNEYIITDIDDSYGQDKYGNPASYISLSHIINGKVVGGGLGMPSSGIKYIFHKK